MTDLPPAVAAARERLAALEPEIDFVPLGDGDLCVATDTVDWDEVMVAATECMLAVLDSLVERVNVRAEQTMLKTHKLEGAHKAALDVEVLALREALGALSPRQPNASGSDGGREPFAGDAPRQPVRE